MLQKTMVNHEHEQKTMCSVSSSMRDGLAISSLAVFPLKFPFHIEQMQKFRVTNCNKNNIETLSTICNSCHLLLVLTRECTNLRFSWISWCIFFRWENLTRKSREPFDGSHGGWNSLENLLFSWKTCGDLCVFSKYRSHHLLNFLFLANFRL